MGLLAAACIAGQATAVSAQLVEIAPFGGYRFGGGFFERVTNQDVDLDGAPAIGLTVNVPLHDGLFVEGLFTHQKARVTVPATLFAPATRWDVVVDHWQAGGLQEFDYGRARPFLTGMLGLTRYAAAGDNEVRFVVSAGGGVKLMPMRRVGLRLDGRVFATFVDADGSAVACTPGICLVAINVDVVWQMELSAGLVVALGR